MDAHGTSYVLRCMSFWNLKDEGNVLMPDPGLRTALLSSGTLPKISDLILDGGFQPQRMPFFASSCRYAGVIHHKYGPDGTLIDCCKLYDVFLCGRVVPTAEMAYASSPCVALGADCAGWSGPPSPLSSIFN